MSIFSRIKLNKAGDTLVEVLFATTLLSIVLAGAYTLSNRATRINQQAFERTQVNALLQQQAEFVRSARDSFNPQQPGASESETWAQIVGVAGYPGFVQGNVPDLLDQCNNLATLPASRSRTFHLSGGAATADPNDLEIDVDAGIDLVNDLYRVWTEIDQDSSGDFWNVHVFGCWDAVGNNNEQNNVTSVILRLKDPRQ